MVVAAILLFLGLYTWNIRSGYLDAAIDNTGMEIVGLFLVPIDWLKTETSTLWERYVDLVGTREENEHLKKEVARLSFELTIQKERAAENEYLQQSILLTPPAPWPMSSARVLAWRMGPFSALETILIDRGASAGAKRDDPVITHRGVVGRVIRVAPSVSTVLMLTDLNSRIAVRGERHRSSGILAGNGPGEPLRVLYVPVTTVMEEGETLITSGLDGFFPPGLPVGHITSIQRSDRSQFQAVTAEPFVDFQKLESVAMLDAPEPSIDRLAAENITPPQSEENASQEIDEENTAVGNADEDDQTHNATLSSASHNRPSENTTRNKPSTPRNNAPR